MTEFTVGDTDFLLAGRPVRLLSGALHYFRVHEGQWGHRLAMLRAMGLNCVETYVPWNLHEPRPGSFRDVPALGRFLDAAQGAGLRAIVRPGPYICAEWENGGLPHWLTGESGARVRTRDERFLGHVERWFVHLLREIVPRQFDRGGPVLMVQVENEYGSYGSDQVYLRRLADLLRGGGVRVPLFTSDGPEDHMLTGGSLPGVLATVNFGSHARVAFETLRRHRPTGPLMCAEFWCGWFDHWGAEHVVRDPGGASDVLREILECGASVNLYMAHGGTNFGGWAGANRGGGAPDDGSLHDGALHDGALHDGALHEGTPHDGTLEPDVTSYDYDAPIDEYGRPTEKFWRFRSLLAAYTDTPLPELPSAPASLGSPATVDLTGWASLSAVLDALGGPETEHPVPPAFEELDVDRGLVRYTVDVPGPRRPYPLTVRGLRDLATVYVDGQPAGVLTEDEPRLKDPVAGPARVDLWVESLGRVNYGPRAGETKGITGGVLHERQYLHGVRARALRLDAFDAGVERVPFGALPATPGTPGAPGAPGLYRGTVTVRGAGDACLELPGWTRGFAWINGFNLGRYWSVGPQRSLYVPGPVLREGANEVWLLEFGEVSREASGPLVLRGVDDTGEGFADPGVGC
ncbi:beta-galactosidase family protein [Streptomyces sp. NBC_00878]|uniref:glycoside hydrolase family 35 protein n=1 Tax=Streptomyces sp. NBC_00878 TaxID=2975854 RepID=UPI0022583DEE|nr:beta-galactosidase family protein [Streptomyces sp. NBC_00878]MCX4909504.1 beta-galactosidase [Streptomyces sp. NBC_00878]